MDLLGKRVVVVGLGKSGQAVARFLKERGAQVIGNDARAAKEMDVELRQLSQAGVELALGGHDESVLCSADLIVVSPGVPPLPALASAERSGIPIVSEVEVASWFIKGTLIGITGTNGKSTVTTLVGDMCKATGRPCFVGGNLGTPLITAVDTPAAEEDGIVVVELSSFQLERVHRLRVNIAAVLNVTDDHLDRYASFSQYAKAKGNIFSGQEVDDHAVFPDFEATSQELAETSRGHKHAFGGEHGEVRVDAGAIVDIESDLVFRLADMKLAGIHNADNACAAALIGRLAGVSSDVIAATLRTFEGLPHRMQFVREHQGVRYFDDSKATNVGAAVASVNGCTDKVVLIAGGKDKGGSYAPLVQALQSRARGCVVMGESAPLIQAALGETTYPVENATGMQDAILKAKELALPGDIVLLAPACSSFDMFSSYAERGDAFQRAVHALSSEVSS